MKRSVPATDGSGVSKSEKFTHRQELEVLASRRVQDAVDKLEEPVVPDHYKYVWGHFWALFEMCGQEMTLRDLKDYADIFAPSMNAHDLYTLLKLRNAANSQIRELEDGVK